MNRWKSTLAAASVLVLLMVGCAGGQAREAATDNAPPASSLAFGCDEAAGLVGPLADGMYLSDSSVQRQDALLCMWSIVPGADTYSGSALDFFMEIEYIEPQTAEKTSVYCEQRRTSPSALDDRDGCAIDSLSSPAGAQATIPHFDYRIDYSCEATVNCAPDMPAAATDEAGLAVIERIGFAILDGTIEAAPSPEPTGDAPEVATGNDLTSAEYSEIVEACFDYVVADDAILNTIGEMSQEWADGLLDMARNGYCETVVVIVDEWRSGAR